MKNTIYPCLWFDGNAREAMELYCSVFDYSEIEDNTPMVVTARLHGQLFMGLNGGPEFKPNPSISFMVICETDTEAERYWEKLSEEGAVLMPLGKYDWSEKYGWVADKFGINWQIYLGNVGEIGQKIVPTLMFSELQQGKAEQAIRFYTSVFKHGAVKELFRYPSGPTEGQVQHTRFTLNDYVLMAMDSGVPQPFSFTEGVSLVVECATQEEIDHYWDAFTREGAESMCGWCKDPFGVSWQIIPGILGRLMNDVDTAKRERVMAALLKMKKLDVTTLVNA